MANWADGLRSLLFAAVCCTVGHTVVMLQSCCWSVCCCLNQSLCSLSLFPLQLKLIDHEAALYAASACGYSLAHVMETTLCA